MSITRKFLKGMGLTDEQQEAIMDAHIETVNGLKADIDRYKADAEKLPNVQKELDDLKGNGDGSWKEKYNNLSKEFGQYKQDQAEKEKHSAKKSAVRALMKEAGIGEKHLDAVLKVYDVNGVELDENGEIKDASKVKKSIETDWSDFIIGDTTLGAQTATPLRTQGNGNTMTKDEIMKIKDTAQRQAAMAANLPLFGIE